jgi:hypothetical protein
MLWFRALFKAYSAAAAVAQVCYISEDYWRRHGRRPDVQVSLCLAADKVFGIPRYAETIQVGQHARSYIVINDKLAGLSHACVNCAVTL